MRVANGDIKTRREMLLLRSDPRPEAGLGVIAQDRSHVVAIIAIATTS